MVKYEFLKIVRKKSTLIILAVSLILTSFLFGLPIMQYQTYSEDGAIKGKEGIAFSKKQFADLSVPLTEEYITEIIQEVQQLFENPDNIGYDGNEQFLIGDAYWNGIAPREKLLNMVAKTYDSPNENSGYQKLASLNGNGHADFYQALSAKMKTLLNMPERALSEEQKGFWSRLADKVAVPLQYGYYEGWEIIMSSLELLMIAILSVCVVIAPILSAKYGKTKLISAKIMASFLFGTLAFTLHVVVACGLPLAAFGIDGWNLPIQIANTMVPYPFTFLQAALLSIFIIYLILFAMISLTLFLSSKMKTPYLVLLVLVPVLFLPMFLTPNGTTGAYNLMLFLLPYRAAMPEIGKFISYQFGSLVLDAFSVRAILYVVLAAVLLPFARRGFQKHQVL